MTHYTRAQIGLQPSRGRASLVASEVEGIACHWPGMKGTRHTVESVMLALRGWQRFHQGKGWSDIAYEEAVDQMGNSYELRGLTTRSAANGDRDVNRRFGALLLVLGPGELPSVAMVNTVRERVAKHRGLFPDSRRIVGHGQIRAAGTECPGALAQGRINAGTFEPVAVVPTKLPARVARFLESSKAEVKRLRKARRVARRRGENTGPITRVIKRVRRTRQIAKKRIPRR